jgi:hypothetical protein
MLQAFKRDFAELPAFRGRQLDRVAAAGMRQRARDFLAQQSSQCTAPLSILSAEAIGTFDVEELRDLRSFVGPFFRRVTLFQYFRPLKSRMESAFQEKLKHGATTLEQKFPLAYCQTIALQDSVFGKDNVHVHKYDSLLFPQGDVVLHFLEQIGLDSPNNVAGAAVNAGLSLPATQLLYVYRLFFPILLEGDRQRVDKLFRLSGEPLRFHSALYQELVVLSAHEVASFERRAGFSVAEQLDADDATGIRSEEDLLAIPERSIAWLYSQLGLTRVAAKPDLKAIASLVSQLVVRLP